MILLNVYENLHYAFLSKGYHLKSMILFISKKIICKMYLNFYLASSVK